jgi:hypothetical protein
VPVCKLSDYKLPPWCKWDRLFSVMKCSVWWCKLRTFWDNMSRTCHRLPEASVTSSRCCVTNQKSEDLVNSLSWQCRLVVLCGLSSRMLGRAESRWGLPPSWMCSSLYHCCVWMRKLSAVLREDQESNKVMRWRKEELIWRLEKLQNGRV